MMKACGSEMPHGWVKPGPLQGWAQGVICNLKALSALNVNNFFVGVMIIAMIRMSRSHAPEQQRKMSKSFPFVVRWEIRVQR